MEDESFPPPTQKPSSPVMDIYDDGLPNPAPTPFATESPVPAPAPAPSSVPAQAPAQQPAPGPCRITTEGADVAVSRIVLPSDDSDATTVPLPQCTDWSDINQIESPFIESQTDEHPAPAPELAPDSRIPSGPSTYYAAPASPAPTPPPLDIDIEIAEYPTFQPAMAPAMDPHPGVCYQLVTGEPIKFSPRTTMFTNHCLRIVPSDQQHVIQIKAEFERNQNLKNIEMVVFTEPLTDVIDPDTRSIRSCAEICDIQRSRDCHCYSATVDNRTGHQVFIAEESLYHGLSTEKFFNILTDFRMMNTLEMTQFDGIINNQRGGLMEVQSGAMAHFLVNQLMNAQCIMDRLQISNRKMDSREMTVVPVVIQTEQNNEGIRCLMESGTSCQWIAEFGQDYHVTISNTNSESMFFNMGCTEMGASFDRLNELEWIFNAGLASLILGLVLGIVAKMSRPTNEKKKDE